MSIEIRLIEEYPEEILKDLMRRNLEQNQIFFNPDSYLNSGDIGHQQTSKKLKIAAYDGDRIVGLSYGASVNKHRFVMQVSLVEKEYRGQGIYTRMLDCILENAYEFDEIDSFHHQFNNVIISKKLRHGFYIIGMETSPAVGPLIKMRYFNNRKLFNIMCFRTGLLEQSELER